MMSAITDRQLPIDEGRIVDIEVRTIDGPILSRSQGALVSIRARALRRTTPVGNGWSRSKRGIRDHLRHVPVLNDPAVLIKAENVDSVVP